jgi:hypothetical protein
MGQVSSVLQPVKVPCFNVRTDNRRGAIRADYRSIISQNKGSRLIVLHSKVDFVRSDDECTIRSLGKQVA